MATTVVEFDGWQLIGATPAGGESWVLEMTGWIGRTLRRARLSRAQQSGDWATSGSVAGRSITITGKAKYDTPGPAAVERRLMSALGGNGAARVVVTDAMGTLNAKVETDSVIITPTPDDELTFDWSFVLYATDPLVYGAETFGATTLAGIGAGTGLVYPLAYPLDYGVPPGVTPGAITLPNDGTGTYWPRLRIDGPVPNPAVTLVETGDTIRYAGTLTAGQWLDIDCGNRRVLLNGSVSVRHLVLSTGRWLAIPPGGGSVTWTADAADPAAALSAWGYQSAWE